MAVSKTYVVGYANTVRRLDNHIAPWVNIDIPVIPGTGNMHCQDVMTDPDDGDRVVVVGNVSNGNTGIMMSYDAGVTWFKPGGSWNQGKVIWEVWWLNSTTIWAVAGQGIVLLSTDGGLTFNTTPNAVADGGIANTNCIHAISDQIVVVGASASNGATDNTATAWKTIDGGVTWTALNGDTIMPGISVTGATNGIWISDDEQEIILTTSYGQYKTTNGGFGVGDFVSTNQPFTRGGYHLTWFPSYGAPDNFRHTGGAASIGMLNESVDTGATWVNTKPYTGIMRGAHFYTASNGYYLIQGEAFVTTDGGVSGMLSLDAANTGVDVLSAVWSSLGTNEVYCLTNCQDESVVLYSSEILLSPYVGMMINLEMLGYGTDICWTVSECLAPNIYQEQQITAVVDSFDTCEECLPPPPTSICYDLVSCNGGCDDQLGVQAPFIAPDPTIGSLWYINDDISCIYEVYPLRQAIYAQDTYTDFSLPGGDFQLGNDDHTFQVTSLILDGVEYITTPVITYLMNEVNYQPVECTGVSCVNVLPNTTENGWSNLATYLNAIFDLFNLTLEAFPCDLTACEIDYIDPVSLFKILYREGSEFQISIQRIAPISGLQQIVVTSLVGNISYETINAVEFSTCNSNVYCPVTQQIQIDSVTFWDGPCPTPIPEIEIGEACDVIPVYARLGEPGFSWKNCDPNKVVGVKTQFAKAVYNMMKQVRYGITTCCDFDLDKIDIKNSLLDLGKLYDPEACVDAEVIIADCCPQPCNVIAEILVPSWETCPAPLNALAVLVADGGPIVLCLPPTGIPYDSGTPLTAEAVLFIL